MEVTPLPMVTLVQAGAVLECTVPDAADAIGDRDIGQALAVIERICLLMVMTPLPMVTPAEFGASPRMRRSRCR